MNEYTIQDWLYGFTAYRKHESQIPNIYLYFWESDFISVTLAGFVHEFEIKISKADFKHDFKKTERHESIENGLIRVADGRSEWMRKFDEIHGNKFKDTLMRKRPNYFWYVCPPGLIAVSDVPKYAGLLYAGNTFYDTPVKAAPRLHGEKISENARRRIGRTYGFKYWDLRKTLNDMRAEKGKP